MRSDPSAVPAEYPGIRIVARPTPGQPPLAVTVPVPTAVLRAELIHTARSTVRVMRDLAAARENAAASYRRMARHEGPHRLRYLQHAAQLDEAAARARQFAAHELEQIDKWQQRDAG
jgi:hypothetical protein